MSRNLLIAVLLGAIGASAVAGPALVNYQGSVVGPGNQPVPDGSYDMRFEVFNAATGGTNLWSETDTAVTVSGGLFSTVLGDATPLGNLFDTPSGLWLEVSVDVDQNSTFESDEVYSPRVRIVAVPYAIDADTLDGQDATDFALVVHDHDSRYHTQTALGTSGSGAQVHWNNLTAVPGGFADGVDNDSGGDITAVNAGTGLAGGGPSGDVTLNIDPLYLNGLHWALTGNTVTSGTHFLGSLNAVPLELRTSGTRTLLLDPTTTSPNILIGHTTNTITAGVYGATISGGGDNSNANRVTERFATIGGGRGNRAGNDNADVVDREYATVGGGGFNVASGVSSTVGGGFQNTAAGRDSTVAGGIDNVAADPSNTIGGGGRNRTLGLSSVVSGGFANLAGNTDTTIGGGYLNEALGYRSTIAGGAANATSESYATVSGGQANTAGAISSTVSGGFDNMASGQDSTVGGGFSNSASGFASVIAGGQFNATTGTFSTVNGGRGNTAGAGYAIVGGGLANRAGTDYAIAGGGYQNEALGLMSTVAGGGNNNVGNRYATVSGGRFNTASAVSSTVSGGYNNTASATDATVGGGVSNSAPGYRSTVGGGAANVTTGSYSLIAGGFENEASGSYSVVGGGYSNASTATVSTVGGGYLNTARNSYATVGGGVINTASGYAATAAGGRDNEAGGDYATVSGGANNSAAGRFATVTGGTGNSARGSYSFAAGRRARANSTGCFAWADSTNADFNVSNNNVFGVRASGGVYFFTNGSLTAGSYLAAGSGTWNSVSDRNVKHNVEPVDENEVLEKLAKVPISTWNYESEDPSIRHMGPMAQDLHAAFGLGDSDKSIATIDADGISLAAIQGLYRIVKQKDSKIAEQEGRITEQQDEIDALKARLAAIEEQLARR